VSVTGLPYVEEAGTDRVVVVAARGGAAALTVNDAEEAARKLESPKYRADRT
jgi:hypothetical protein